MYPIDFLNPLTWVLSSMQTAGFNLPRIKFMAYPTFDSMGKVIRDRHHLIFPNHKPYCMRYTFLLLLLVAFGARAQQSTILELVHFPTASADLHENDKQRIVNLVRSFEGKQIIKVEVWGHTDNAGSVEYNQVLSERRATAVAMVLRPIVTVNVEMKFGGESTPVAENETGGGRQLNRRTEILFTIVTPGIKAPEPVIVQPYLKEKEAQVFAVNLDKDTIHITARESSSLTIPPGSLVYKDGKAVTGEVQVIIREYLSAGDMILAGMHTEYEDGFLETGGTIELLYLKGKDTLLINQKKPVQVRIPSDNPKKGMQVYTSPGKDSVWTNTGRNFNIRLGVWAWPVYEDRRVDYTADIQPAAELMKVGRSFTETIYHSGDRNWGFNPRNFVKRSEITFAKLDSSTIKIHSRLSLRKIAKRKGLFTTTKVDTTFYVPYIKGEYFSEVTTMGFCNVDTYRKLAKTTYRITTHGMSGGRLTAIPSMFITVIPAKEIEPGVYEVKVPEGYAFTVTYTGVKEGVYYFGKTAVIPDITRTAALTVKAIEPSEINKQLASIK
jgi:outer membrane protein OmpA-like peptidoglycan-associated protein